MKPSEILKQAVEFDYDSKSLVIIAEDDHNVIARYNSIDSNVAKALIEAGLCFRIFPEAKDVCEIRVWVPGHLKTKI